jgi:hypothetical protein
MEYSVKLLISDVTVARARIRAIPDDLWIRAYNRMYEMISSSVQTSFSKYHLDDVIIVRGVLASDILERFAGDKKYGWITKYGYKKNIRSK